MTKQSVTTVLAPSEQRGGENAAADVSLSATIVHGVLDATPEGLLLVDETGRLLLANRRAAELFGYRRDELVGLPVQVLLQQPAGDGGAGHGRRRDGSEFAVGVKLTLLTTPDGTMTVVAVRDDAERQELEQRRRDQVVDAVQEQIADSLTDTVIRGLFGTGLHLQGLLDRPVDEIRTGIQQAVEEIDRTIRDLRDAIFGLRVGRD